MDSAGWMTLQEHEVLKRALAKIVVLGEEVGISLDQMIALLRAGLTVKELLEHLVKRRQEFALEKRGSIGLSVDELDL